LAKTDHVRVLSLTVDKTTNTDYNLKQFFVVLVLPHSLCMGRTWAQLGMEYSHADKGWPRRGQLKPLIFSFIAEN